nr:surface-adhesin E family protein [Variovorax boronicumulans]
MRFLPIPLLLACACATAAEWTELPLPASSGMTVYQEPGTERSRHNAFVGTFLPNPRQSWFLVDYAVPHRWGLYEVRSFKQWLEFDCKDFSMRVIARRYYEGPMGQGRVLVSERESPNFVAIVPGDPEEAMHRAACAYLKQEEQVATAPAAAASPAEPVTAPATAVPEPAAQTQPVTTPLETAAPAR